MYDYADLKSELTTDPATLGYASMTDAEAAEAMNAAVVVSTRPIPIDEIQSLAFRRGVALNLQAAANGTDPTGVALGKTVLALFASRLSVVYIDDPATSQLLGGLVQAGIMTHDDADATTALASIDTPRSVVVFGAIVSEHDIHAARNL
jgi:hypothetical protein